MSTWERQVALPDLQIPLHDVDAVASVIEFMGDYQPDTVLCVGDEYDFTQIGRWVKGGLGEYDGGLGNALISGRRVFADIREAVGDVPFHLTRSNHTDRWFNYLSAGAPALVSVPGLDYLSISGLRDLDVSYHREPFEFAPGWVLAHGDEGSLSKIPGRTASLLAAKWGRSVLCGHTHRQGLSHEHQSLNGQVTNHLFGLEAGNLMDMAQADYLKAKSANWQQGFALFYVNRQEGIVLPSLIPIVNRSFVVEGQVYSW